MERVSLGKEIIRQAAENKERSVDLYKQALAAFEAENFPSVEDLLKKAIEARYKSQNIGATIELVAHMLTDLTYKLEEA